MCVRKKNADRFIIYYCIPYIMGVQSSFDVLLCIQNTQNGEIVTM